MNRKRSPFAVLFISTMRAIVVGVSYYLVRDLPGLTSSFVSIFVGFLAFDLIVAMRRFSWHPRHWKDLLLLILPRIGATSVTLGLGLFVGILFGIATKLGLPVVIGAVFTLGLSYNATTEIKGNISGYVGMISGIAMFDEIVRLDSWGREWLQDVGGPAGQLIHGTFLALLLGWLVGVVVGSLTRLFLPRGYRHLKSTAYSQPLWLRSFQDVVQLGEEKVLLQVEVSEDSPLVYRNLAEIAFGSEQGVQILSIIRSPEGIISPRGADVILPLDQLVMVLPSNRTEAVIELTKGRVLNG